MMSQTFGQAIADARKKAGLSQKELAARIKKEEGGAISPQYLNDLERGRRNPPAPQLLDQFIRELNIESDWLYYVAGQYPEDLRRGALDQAQVREAFQAFRRGLNREHR